MTIKLGKYALCIVGAHKYNKLYDANVQEQYGEAIKSIAWLEQYDNEGECVAMSEDVMLIYKDGTFAYTSRHAYFKASIFECWKIIKGMETF